MIGLDFTRSAGSADVALDTAIADVGKAIPGGTLLQAGPDLVGLTEMADMFGFSRQNMRKYATGQAGRDMPFPPPAVVGDSSLWHFAEVIAWFRHNTAIQPAADYAAVAKSAARINLGIEEDRVKRILELV
jgi:predicted DNA-binding transcriptional regulator AlpA